MQNEKEEEEISSNLGALFWDTASALPDHTAIHYQGDGECSVVTYRDLRTEVVKVREALRRHASEEQQGTRGEAEGGSTVGSDGRGSTPEVQVVGILSSGPKAVACILGTLVTCGYWYISPHYTRREVTALAERIHPERILVEDTLLPSLEDSGTEVLDTFSVFGTPFKLVSIINRERRSLTRRPKSLVYVVPTSGTTGTPKCVYVPHAAIVPNIHDLEKLFKVTSEDRVFCAAPLTFDPSVIDLFLAFQVGAGLVMVSPKTLRTPRLLLKVLVETKVTILQATPTLFLSLGRGSVRENLLSQGSRLRVLALGGEVFPKGSILKECVGDQCTARIFNLYGLTEVSCWASVWEYVPHGASASPVVDQTPIGEPLSHTEMKVLKENGEEADSGEEGEIYVGGEVRACLVDSGDGATESQAVTHMRPTGDLGLVKDGHIYCLGRLDDQVKRNGQKISLREIECVCLDLPYISQCLVLPCKSRLIMFICTCDEGITLNDIWRDLKNCLAPWKIPDEVVLVNSVPLNTHGKVDTQQLLSLMAETCCPPSHTHTLQGFFSDLWRRILGYEKVREDDQFISCGGNSLTAIQVTARVEEYLGHEVPEFLDALLHDTYSEVFQILRKHHLARKSDTTNGSSSKKIKNNQSALSKPKQNGSIIQTEGEATVCSTAFSDCKNSKGIMANGDQENSTSLSQNENTILAAVSRRGVEIRESTPLSCKLSHNTYTLKWKYDFGKCIDSSPLLAKLADSGMFVFAGSHSHRFACLDAVTGVERWCCILGDRVESSPAISRCGSFVYVGCYDHHLYCVTVKDGRVAWRYRTGGEVKSSPVVDWETGCVAFGSHDKQLHYVGVDGEAKWVLQVSSGSIFSSPCIAQGLVIAATLDGVLCGVDKSSGDVKWKVTLKKPIFSSPAAYSCGVVFGTVRGEVLSYSLTGTFLWQYETKGSIFSSPFILKLGDKLEVIAIGSHDKCVYFLTHLGELMAKYCGGSPVYGTPFLYLGEDRCAFGAVVCETHGRCCVLRVRVGGEEQEGGTLEAGTEVMWEKEFPGELFASPVCYENRLWIGCRDDFLYCFNVVDAGE
ncbi:beta-alanine-activating enzyme-like [Eriocheir sinensis]|uniref:beta-alanine-activating enzyme-like n=1 Tax=Eriocheir sinensis TaxID=95602 RepID=UPI0021C7FEBC|nr:beta-alanine-activating enzyme-like [Eriocheir sinensis]